ncbi:MAG: nuclear transport factor 2 family protein [Myxococcota bacterium]
MDADHPVARWHALVESKDPRGLDAFLADDVVFHSPVVHTPQHGKAIATAYLTAALHVLANEHWRYVREVVGERDACLEFVTELDGIHVNGVDLMRWNDEGRVVDFKVMVRPLKAVNQLHAMMKAMLERGG